MIAALMLRPGDADTRPMIRRLLAIALVAALAACTACGGSSSSSTVKTGPKPVSGAGGSWKVYAPKGGGYRVQVHTGWLTLDAASLANSSQMRAIEAKNPGLASGFAIVSQMAHQPGVLIAFDRTPAGRQVASRTGFAPNIIVRRIPLGSTKSDAALLDIVLAQGRANVNSIPAVIGKPSASRLAFAGLPAGVLTYLIRENTVVGKIRVSESDYATVRDGTAYTIYCSTVAGDVQRLHADCAHALHSFAFTG